MTKTYGDNDPRFLFVKPEVAALPPAGLIEHIKHKWWICHPEKGLLFVGVGPKGRLSYHPMANSSEEIVKRFIKAYPWAEVRFVESVFRSINPQDYC